MIIAIVSITLAAVVIAWRLAKGINYMQENHPEYKGEDLFDEDLKNLK